MAKIEFAQLRAELRPNIDRILRQLLPRGRQEGSEWVALNPRRNDRNLGSFKINLNTGRWADFATGDSGGDIISLVAFLDDSTQIEAARKLQHMIGSSFD